MAWQKYREFENNADAEVLIRLLDEHQVDYELEELPKLRLEEESQLPVVVKLEEKQIRKVNKLLLAEEERQSAYEAIETFDNIDQARDLLDLLEKHEIPYRTGETGSAIDTTHTNSPTLKRTYVMVQTKYFKKVNALQEEIAQDLIQDLGKDYHLYKMDDQELLDILEHQDEWHINDVLMAQRILGERGIKYSRKDIELMKQRRWIDLRQAKSVEAKKIGFAYLMAVIGGFIGIFYGMHYLSDKGYDPDGRSFYTYDENARKHGRQILILGIVVFIAVILNVYFLN
ncbi:MAG: hypothetical protein GY810_10695 [Aureispira sp.]|nr:hypothetical protein [Aureispira sp.]